MTLRLDSLRALALALAVALALAALTGCKRKPEDLEVWRPSKAKNGLEKLQEWIASPDQLMETRIRAAEILLEEEYAYAVNEALKTSTDADRKVIMASLMPTVEGWYNAGDGNRETYMFSGSKQVTGKDAAFQLLPHADEAQRKTLEGFLMDWLANGEFFERDQMGKVKNNQIAEVLGPPAGPALLKALANKYYDQNELAKIIRKLPDAELQRKTAIELVKMAQADLPAIPADIQNALLATENDAVVPFFVMVVPNEEVDATFRTVAIERIQKLKGPASTPIFLEWIKGNNELLRWVSIQAVAESRGKDGLPLILANLPTDKPYGADDPEGFKGEAERLCSEEVKKEMTDTEPIFIQQLKTGSWPARAISLTCIQFVGTAASRPAVEALLEDKTEIPAWGADVKTLGDLARQTLDKLPN